MGLFHRARAPAQVTARFEADERTLSFAEDERGTPLLASTVGLWLPAGDGPRRIGWADVVRAGWRDRVLTVIEGVEAEPGYVDSLPPVTFALPAPDGLPAAIRERVTRSVVVSQRHPLSGTAGVRIVGRKVPGHDGLLWRAHLDPGAHRGDPVVRSQVAELIARAAAEESARPG